MNNDLLSVAFKAICNRMSLLTTATWWFNIVFVNVHTPTEEKKEEDSENFYSLLDSTLSNIIKNSFILEDFNAKIEKKEYFKPTIGSHSLHHIFQNDNGCKLIGVTTNKGFKIKSTMFPHKNIHKGTWTTPMV